MAWRKCEKLGKIAFAWTFKTQFFTEKKAPKAAKFTNKKLEKTRFLARQTCAKLGKIAFVWTFKTQFSPQKIPKTARIYERKS